MLNIFSVLMRRRLQHIHRETAYYKVPKNIGWEGTSYNIVGEKAITIDTSIAMASITNRIKI